MTPFEFNNPEDTNTFLSKLELGWRLGSPPRKKAFSLFTGQPPRYLLPSDVAGAKRRSFFRKAAAFLVGLAVGGYMVYGVLRPNLETAAVKP